MHSKALNWSWWAFIVSEMISCCSLKIYQTLALWNPIWTQQKFWIDFIFLNLPPFKARSLSFIGEKRIIDKQNNLNTLVDGPLVVKRV